MAAPAQNTLAQTVRRLLGPRWLAMHVVIWAAVVVMVELGRWQLRVSNRKHFDLQNFSYVLQWWAFAACTVAFWLRAMRNVHIPPAAATPPGGALAVRAGSAGEVSRRVQSGPAELVAPARGAQEAAVYRGYVIPLSAQVPSSSEGDSQHALYNDYLWQLSMADATSTRDRASFYRTSAAFATAEVDNAAPVARASGESPGAPDAQPSAPRVIDATPPAVDASGLAVDGPASTPGGGQPPMPPGNAPPAT